MASSVVLSSSELVLAKIKTEVSNSFYCQSYSDLSEIKVGFARMRIKKFDFRFPSRDRIRSEQNNMRYDVILNPFSKPVLV